VTSALRSFSQQEPNKPDHPAATSLQIDSGFHPAGDGLNVRQRIRISIMTYDQWLALSEDERETVHFQQWNVYSRDGYVIAMTAAVRLAESCGLKVFHMEIGTYHGGGYLLHLYVPDDDCRRMPPMLEQRFEGFRVVWFPVSRMGLSPSEIGTISGLWRHEDDDTDVEFSFDAAPNPPKVSGRCLKDGEQLVISGVRGHDKFLSFSSTVPSTGYFAQHTFRLTGRDTCTQDITLRETWKRAADKDNGEQDGTSNGG
jgi:hypothetical protein